VPSWRWREAALALTAFEISFGHALFGVAVLLVVTVAELVEGEPLWIRSPIDAGLLALLGVAAASALASPWRDTALTAAAATAAIALPVTRAAVLAVRRRPRFALTLLWAWAAGAVLAAAWALGSLGAAVDARAALPDLTPNALGTTLAVGLVVLTGLSLDARGPRRLVLFLGLPVVALGLVLTWSRGGWLAAAAGLLLLLSLRRNRTPWWGLLGAAAAVAAAVPILATRWAWHLDRLRQLLPAAGPFSRVAVWKVALRVIAEHPVLGTGLATFGLVYERYGASAGGPAFAPSAHNLLLHTAAELGVLGVAALTALVAGGTLALLRWSRGSPPAGPARTAAATAVASTGAFLMHQMVDVTAISFAVSVALFLLLGVGAGAAAPEPAP
jgi:putative inorganic carbon (HCO3(-)) transporter